MFDGVKGMPAKVCLGLSSVIMLVYSVNFIFFADCHVINGDGCTSILTNGADADHASYGRGADVLQLAGTLMLGLFMGNMLLLNEGAKGKWSLMLPGLIGFIVLLWVLAVTGDYESSSSNPMIATAIGTLLYGMAYYFLIEEGVNEGLNFEFNGLQVKDTMAAAMLGLAVLIGVLFTINNLFFAEGYLGRSDSTFLPVIGNYDGDYYAAESTAPNPILIKVIGSLFIPYVLYAVNILRTGPQGKWPIMHVSMFGLGAFALASIMGVIFFDEADWETAGNKAAFTQNAVITTLVWFLIVASYARLRAEGGEDGMTIMGEEVTDADFFLMKMYPAIMAVIAVILLATNLYSFSGL